MKQANMQPSETMEVVGKLTGGMAHDFNNLLGIVIGNLDLLSDRATDEETKELVREALEAALRGTELTQGLLAFSRRQPLHPDLVSPNAIAAKVADLVRVTLTEGTEIALDLSADAWPVFADPAQLEASMIAVLDNARDAMPKGGTIRLSTANRVLDAAYAAQLPGLAAGDYAVIEIADCGRGMTPEVAERAFEPFFSTKESRRGAGLGLSRVFGFMRQSGGHTAIDSEIGAGTTVQLFLPRARSAGAAETASEPGGNETVLVVEDNTSMRRVVARQLEELGYRVLEAEDGPAALELLADKDVDLLFTDVIMPGGMRGDDLARNAIERKPGMKAVLTSGSVDATGCDGDIAGDLRLLHKPYRRSELALALREALEE